MSAVELAALNAILRREKPDLSDRPPAAREAFEMMLATIAAPEGTGFAPVRADGVEAYWSTPSDGAVRGVLMYLHGGGYMVGSAWGYRGLWSQLAAAAGARGFGVDYRLAPEQPFPAAPEDAFAAYYWLLRSGVAPGEIVIGGDSAGGGLALSTLVRARDAGLPMPAAALLMSPWVDLACVGASMDTKAADDAIMTRARLLKMADYYRGHAAADDPDVSPLHADLSGLPPMFIQVGSSEVLLDDSLRLAARAANANVAVTLEVWPGMPHVWQMFGAQLSEARAAIAGLGAYAGAALARSTQV